MHWTYFLFSFTALTLSVIMMFSFAASIKEEIPDLNVSLLSREDDPLSFHRLRPKTTKDRQMQALMKIQKKVRASASHKVHSVPTKEENMQVMMKSSKPGQIRSGKTSDQLTPTIKESQSRVREKSRPQFPGHHPSTKQ